MNGVFSFNLHSEMSRQAIRYFGVFYSKPYHHLVWLMDKRMQLILEREDQMLELPEKNAKFVRSLHFGYRKLFEHLDLEIVLLKNTGLQGNVLVKSKPMPALILAGKGDDPAEYFQTINFELSGLQGIQSVQPLNPKVFTMLDYIQFS